MQAVKAIGLDIAKSVFQVHGVDADGQVVIRRKLKRRYVLTFFEKLPATSHHWSGAPDAQAPARGPAASIRAHLAEFGIVAPIGRQGVEQLYRA